MKEDKCNPLKTKKPERTPEVVTSDNIPYVNFIIYEKQGLSY